jgi:hypothetical protein
MSYPNLLLHNRLTITQNADSSQPVTTLCWGSDVTRTAGEGLTNNGKAGPTRGVCVRVYVFELGELFYGFQKMVSSSFNDGVTLRPMQRR